MGTQSSRPSSSKAYNRDTSNLSNKTKTLVLNVRQHIQNAKDLKTVIHNSSPEKASATIDANPKVVQDLGLDATDSASRDVVERVDNVRKNIEESIPSLENDEVALIAADTATANNKLTAIKGGASSSITPNLTCVNNANTLPSIFGGDAFVKTVIRRDTPELAIAAQTMRTIHSVALRKAARGEQGRPTAQVGINIVH